MNKTRTLFAIILLALLPPLRVSAEDPKPAADYFPLRVGDSWTYRNDGGAGEYTYKVEREDPQPGQASRFLVLLTAGVKVENFYSKADGWVLLHGLNYPEHEGLQVKYDPPKQYLPNPPVEGKTWEWSGKDQSGNDRHEESRVAGIEEITVVAGKFRAMKIVSKITGASQPMTKTYWYAEGVGMVKTTTDAGETKYGSELIDYSFKKKPEK